VTPKLTRREAIVAGIAGAATFATGEGAAGKSARTPTVFLPHGGGPWPWVEMPFGSKAELSALATYLRDVRTLPLSPPKALLVVSAHWEEAVPTVMTSPRPPMLYDYYGFPPESYAITWPAPGHPELAARVRKLLEGAGFHTGEDPARGFDHGTFVPLKLAYPQADVPVVQLSLKEGLDPKEHLAMGRALAPLRDEGVYIIGSGMTYHNLRAFHPRARPQSEAFDTWLGETIREDAVERDRRLVEWTKAPAARAVHPREEHLLPLMVIAGAAGADRGAVTYNGTILDLRISGYHFG
jgi:aromatic ring-opening dioxygenase catalytic subunit (LigB family)